MSELTHASTAEFVGKALFGPPLSPHDAKMRIYYAHEYPLEYIWAVTGVIGVLTITHIIGFLSNWASRANRKPSLDSEKGALAPGPTSTLGRFWGAVKSLVNIVLYRLPIPLRRFHHLNIAEGALIGGYLAGCVWWSISSTPDVTVPSNWSSRAGIMCVVQIPFIIALAGKNNVVSFFTGLSHEKLNVIHRAAGRTCLITAILHVSGKLSTWNAYHISFWEEVSFQWGMVGFVSICVVGGLSIRPVRSFAYEVFLMIHIIFVFMFMLGVMMHQPDSIWRRYTYPGFVLWGFDRLLRFLRMAFLSFAARPVVPAVSGSPSSASVERLSNDTVRLTVRRSRNTLSSWRAGQHFFIIAPGVSALPWEAHPFTPASIPHTVEAGSIDASEHDVEIKFIVRGRNGFTKRLLSHAMEHEATGNMKPPTLIVDGPYGVPPNLTVYDTAILIAGGSGVSYTLSMLLNLIHQSRLGTSRTSRVLFIWAVRDESHVNWIAPSLHSALALPASNNALDIDVRIFVTQRSREIPILPSTDINDSGAATPEKKGSITELSSLSLVQVLEARGGNIVTAQGRPDVRKIVEDELSSSDGRHVSVDVSGPSALADSVRTTLATSSYASPAAALRGGPSVTLHTETFGW